MSIKMKLLVSYVGMILIPVVLIIFTGTLFSPPKRHDFSGELSMGIKFQNKQSTQLYQEISLSIKARPDLYSEPNDLRRLETEHGLRALHIGIIAYRNNKMIYISPTFSPDLQNYALQKKNNFGEWFIIHNKAFSVQQFNFTSQKSEQCTLYLLTDATSVYRFGKMMIILIPVALTFFIIITNGLLTYFMSRNIIRPLRTLQNATEQIKAGNLDFQIPIRSKDELGKLAEAFEEMRSRLKESLDIQMQYETNRKELIAGISHDLKTPVTSIKGYVEGILDGVADSPDKIRHYLKTIQANTNNLRKCNFKNWCGISTRNCIGN